MYATVLPGRAYISNTVYRRKQDGAGIICAGETELTQNPSFDRECFITAAYASAQMR